MPRVRHRSSRTFGCAALLLALAAAAAAQAPDPALVEQGRRLYREGRLPSGEPVRATREGGSEVKGADAACTLCHQRSGLGFSEGAIPMPPIAGPVLFSAPASYGSTPRRAPGMAFDDYAFRTRPAYDDATLAQAIRAGVNPDGQRLDYLMPRYALGDDDMRALVAYLRTLSAQAAPGIDGGVVRFATVVTPDAPPARRDATLDVLRACFAERYPMPPQGERQAWQLDVWTLDGPPEGWQAQLHAYQARRPAFAMVSGAGGDTWAPVERFCESEGMPCLFPNIDAPRSRGDSWYTFYFFAGVSLEAEVLASQLRERRAGGLARVVQVHPEGGPAAQGAQALRTALAGSGLAVEDRRIDARHPARALRGVARDAALVLWLDPRDLRALTRRAAPPPGPVFLSGLVGGLEGAPLPAAWKARAVLTYPFDAPGRWQLRMQRNLRPWLAQQGLVPRDERVQGNTLAACNVLTESMLRLRGRQVRDHLVEWVENYPSAMGNAPAPQAFPRFSLGPGQRFSSKGAYLVRFAPGDDARLTPVQPDWIVP